MISFSDHRVAVLQTMPGQTAPDKWLHSLPEQPSILLLLRRLSPAWAKRAELSANIAVVIADAVLSQ